MDIHTVTLTQAVAPHSCIHSTTHPAAPTHTKGHRNTQAASPHSHRHRQPKPRINLGDMNHNRTPAVVSHNCTHTPGTGRTGHIYNGDTRSITPSHKDPAPRYSLSHMVTKKTTRQTPWRQAVTPAQLQTPTPGHTVTKTHSEPRIRSPLPPARTDPSLRTRPGPAQDSQTPHLLPPLVASGSLRS